MAKGCVQLEVDGENTVEIWAKQKQTSGVKVAKHLGKISDIETVKKTFNDKLSTFQSKPTKSRWCLPVTAASSSYIKPLMSNGA